MVIKVAGGILGIGLIGTGGIAIAKPHWLGMDYMPKWHSLSEDNGFVDSTYSTGKFANKLTKYLVGVTHKKDGQDTETNQAWWEWSFRRLQKGNVSGGAFKPNEKVDSGFKKGTGTADKPKALNQVCEDAYKAETGKVKANTTTDGEFDEEHVWKYCSPFGGKLKTVKDVDNASNSKKYATEKIGGKKENELISATGPENDKFWEIRNKEFQATGTNSLTSGDTDSYFFKNKQGKTIKELCEYVYKQSEDSSGGDKGKLEATTAVKYCSLKGDSTQ